MRLKVRSIPENWDKEFNGNKPNTIRVLDGNDVIEVENTETGDVFTRRITDITTWKGMIVISWKHENGLVGI